MKAKDSKSRSKNLKKKEQKLTQKKKKTIAEKLYNAYYAKLLDVQHIHGYLQPPYRDQPPSIQKTFDQTAVACFGIGARPRDYINAQFGSFERFSVFAGRRVFPQPHHLKGLNAVARYLEHKAELDRTKHREKAAEVTAHEDEFFSEERKLKAMMKRERMPAPDVLLKNYEEFSPSFLDHHGVWALVEEVYGE